MTTTFDDEQRDRQAIIDLTIEYCWTLDSHVYDGLANVFAANATALLGEELDGLEQITARVDRALTKLDASHHLVANHQVHIDGDTATCRCYFQAQHVRSGMEGGETYIVAGRYLDALSRTSDGWRITRRVLVKDWTTGNAKVLSS